MIGRGGKVAHSPGALVCGSHMPKGPWVPFAVLKGEGSGASRRPREWALSVQRGTNQADLVRPGVVEAGSSSTFAASSPQKGRRRRRANNGHDGGLPRRQKGRAAHACPSVLCEASGPLARSAVLRPLRENGPERLRRGGARPTQHAHPVLTSHFCSPATTNIKQKVDAPRKGEGARCVCGAFSHALPAISFQESRWPMVTKRAVQRMQDGKPWLVRTSSWAGMSWHRKFFLAARRLYTQLSPHPHAHEHGRRNGRSDVHHCPPFADASLSLFFFFLVPIHKDAHPVRQQQAPNLYTTFLFINQSHLLPMHTQTRFPRPAPAHEYTILPPTCHWARLPPRTQGDAPGHATQTSHNGVPARQDVQYFLAGGGNSKQETQPALATAS